MIRKAKFTCLLAALVLGSPSVLFSQSLDEHYSTRFGQEGVNGEVFAALEFDGDLIVAGSLISAGGLEINNIARWDGENWHPLGDGIGGAVYSLAVHNGELIAGGSFLIAGAQSANSLAVWNPKTANWRGFSPGLENGSIVNTLLSLDGSLYVGGVFSGTAGSSGIDSRNIIEWKDSEWLSLGGGLVTVVNDICVLFGDLFAGGESIDKWSLSARSWSPVSYPFNSNESVRSIVCFEGTLAVSTNSRTISLSEGEWTDLGNSNEFRDFRELITIDGSLYGVGFHFFPNDESRDGLFRFSSGVNIWNPVGGALLGDPKRVNSVATWKDKIALGGVFTQYQKSQGVLQTDSPLNVAILDKETSALEGFENGVRAHGRAGGSSSGSVECLLSVPGSGVYAGGEIIYAGETRAPGCALWIENDWSPLGGGVSGTVKAMAHADNMIAVGGDFFNASNDDGSIVARTANLAFWDGEEWIGKGDVGDGTSNIYAMVVDGNEKLVIGGSFGAIDGSSFENVARYNFDNGTWELMPGLRDEVRALCRFGGTIVAAGGSFLTEKPGAVVIWNEDESQWTPLGDVMTLGQFSDAYALAVVGGELYVGGDALRAGGSETHSIFKWDGSEWTPVGSRPNGTVRTIAEVDGRVVIGGDFNGSEGVTLNRIAYFENGVWKPIGSGFDRDVNTLLFDNSQLWVGGRFDKAGGHPAENITYWSGTLTMTPVKLLGASVTSIPTGNRISWEIDDPLGLVTVFKESLNGNREPLGIEPALGRGFKEVVDPRGVPSDRYWLQAKDRSGQIDWFGPLSVAPSFSKTLLSVSQNPFSSRTAIRLSEANTPRNLGLFNIEGQLLRRWGVPVGVQEFQWDGTGDSGTQIPAGIYFIKSLDGSQATSIRVVKLPR